MEYHAKHKQQTLQKRDAIFCNYKVICYGDTFFFLSKELLYASDLCILKSKHYGGQNVAKNVVESVGKVSKSNLNQLIRKGTNGNIHIS